jgi:hypothetical protein
MLIRIFPTSAECASVGVFEAVAGTSSASEDCDDRSDTNDSYEPSESGEARDEEAARGD